jgi:hypothetical protein
MKLTQPVIRKRVPFLPLAALGLVSLANVFNRCAESFCYTGGWPWIAYYGWSDGGVVINGEFQSGGYQGLQAGAAFGDFIVGIVLIAAAVLLQVRWWRAAAN